MKKILFGAVTSCLFLLSCSKSDDSTPAPAADKFMTMSSGSTWNYAFTDNVTPANNYTYTLTSTNRDTTAAGKTYHVFTNSSAGSEYYNITGSDYYRLQAFSLGTTDTTLENLYLKDAAAAGTNWAQNYTITAGGVPIGVTVTNIIQETGLTKTVGTNSYSNVIHVITTISIPSLVLLGGTITTDIHYYYAPKYGMIENDAKIDLVVPGTINQHTDTQTKLVTATIL